MDKEAVQKIIDYDAVVFDFDGTIADLDINWVKAKEGLSKFLTDVDKHLFLLLNKKKIGMSEKINIYLKEYGPALKKDISIFSREVEKNFLKSWTPKPDVVESINKLKNTGVKLFIWTLNTRPVVDMIVDSFQIDAGVFIEIISFESDLYVKPDVVYLKQVLKRHNVRRPVYIGDSYYDVVASKKAKIKYLDFSRTGELFAKFNNMES